MLKNLPRLFLFLLGTILVINLLQAHFTELIFDEAYYWYYSKKLAWGYFDHPPMVAWMIKGSSLFFEGELGVRFMSCLLSASTLIILWMTIDHPKKKEYVPHFFVVAFSMSLLNAYGFFTLPDTPLLFFTALFLYVYKRFIAAPSVILSIVLGVVMAALMYSKYHAVLVIVFVLFSNLKLIRDKYAILAVTISLACYAPHFLWLYEHDFVSIKYHLFERPNQAYDFNKFTLGYLVNLLAIFGLTFPFAYYILYKSKPKDIFSKALTFLTYGVLIFFFISSFSKRVQTQWIIVVSIPMVLLIFNYIIENEKTRKWIYGLGIANIIILLYLRVGLIYEPLFPIVFETHGNKKWVDRLEYDVWDIPVVFENSYRNAPMYEFYSGRKAISLNNIQYRQNQYSIDGSEASVQHKRVFYVTPYTRIAGFAYPLPNGDLFYGEYIDHFESYRRLKVILEKDELDNNLDKTFKMKVFNPYEVDIPLDKLKFGLAYLNDYKEVRDIRKVAASPIDATILVLKSNDTVNFTFKLPKTKMEEPGYFRIGISENDLPYGLNGNNIKLK
ncbi:4-amino-4-deoxy-L-arabinose transferase [Maribacter algarum]|uniref:4-amino-4-deoxy-L-arabinose transferase n=1 Tax=Maribacter algarum (ex Zhang et al. 2020) TaxID=2578118 RepID=A0A5S3PYL8_9FLAO|nr:glycosyltransferase family 39 protein [Maribacter algarum]TMM59382.1 4-amino-4-deoxy-L-arabinose transferase [Maribacter algarum]